MLFVSHKYKNQIMKKVNIFLVIPIFVLNFGNSFGQGVVYSIVTNMPEPPNQMNEYLNILSNKLDCLTPNEKYFINCIVEDDGSLSNFTLLKGTFTSGDNNCLTKIEETANLMGKWKPGLNDGQPVRVKFNLILQKRENGKQQIADNISSNPKEINIDIMMVGVGAETNLAVGNGTEKFFIKGKVANDKQQGDWIWYRENHKPYFKVEFQNSEINSVTGYNYSTKDTIRFIAKGVTGRSGMRGLTLSYWNTSITKQKADIEFNIVNSLIGNFYEKYYDNGQIKEYKDASTQDHVKYYRNGKEEERYNEKTGNKISYFNNGNIKNECKIIDGSGECNEYYLNGKLKIKSEYSKGKQISYLKYDENGNPIK